MSWNKEIVKLQIYLSSVQKVQIASENEAIKLLLSIITIYTEHLIHTELSEVEQ